MQEDKLLTVDAIEATVERYELEADDGEVVWVREESHLGMLQSDSVADSLCEWLDNCVY